MGRNSFGGWILAAFLLRWAVSLHSYSGMNTPPRFGDYEAQRHWMEITIHLPPTEWYRNSSLNDLHWWGLDYPPLSGYQSWLCGKYVQHAEPQALELRASRGYESHNSKTLLRRTVLAADMLFVVPAAVAAMAAFGGPGLHAVASKNRLMVLVALLFSPSVILIDHGHFQYNCIGLGLAAAAAAAAVVGHDIVSAVLFTLSLNHKQMGLYFAPAFFAYLLGKCLQKRTVAEKFGGIAKLGAAVLTTFAILWMPWLLAGAWWDVVLRVFPTQRGLYEDYVANWWCVSSRLIKWGRLLSQQHLVQLCGGATLAALAPAMATQVLRPTPRGFLLCLANSAMSFFLLSYQVHEKSILLPLLPLSLLLGSEQPQLLQWMNIIAVFSMVPLLNKDGLAIAAMGTLAACHAATQLAARMGSGQWPVSRGSNALQKSVCNLSLIGCFAILVAFAALPAPSNLPFLYDALIVSWSFLHFAALFGYTYWLQLQEYLGADQKASKGKQQ